MRPLHNVVPLIDRSDAVAPAPWLEVLRQSVRPDFAVAIYIPEPGDPALWPRSCAVPGCQGPAPYKSMCSNHRTLWARDGRPDVEEWMRSERILNARSRYSRQVRACRMPGCDRSAPSQVCRRHQALAHDHYAGDVTAMLNTHVDTSEATTGDVEQCYVPWCSFPVASRRIAAKDDGIHLCDAHDVKYRKSRTRFLNSTGQHLHVDTWMSRLQETTDPKYRTLDLPETLLWEVRYGLQARHDQRTKRWSDNRHNMFVNSIRRAGLTTLLMDEASMVDALRAVGASASTIGFARFVRASLELLRDRDSLDIYERDSWDLAALGFNAVDRKGVRYLRFNDIQPLWLRSAAKEWAKHRLAQQEISTVSGDLRSLRTLTKCLREARALPLTPQQFDRATVEKFIRVQRHKGYSNNYRRTLLGTLNLLLAFLHRTNLAPGLSTDAVVYTEDIPKMRRPMPRYISEFVMDQIETPEALDSIRSHAGRTLLRVMIETGLRGQCARHLGIDALQRDSHGNPLMRFTNTKFNREAVIPISESLAQVLADQRERTLERWPDTEWLMPRSQQNPDGLLPYADGAWKAQFGDWKKALSLVDEAGRPVNITGHQFRHTVGTRMVNAGVPLEVVRAYLDHSSVQMTEVYARLAPSTVRRSAEAYLTRMDKVFDPEHPTPNLSLPAPAIGRAEPTRSDRERAHQVLDALFAEEANVETFEKDDSTAPGGDTW